MLDNRNAASVQSHAWSPSGGGERSNGMRCRGVAIREPFHAPFCSSSSAQPTTPMPYTLTARPQTAPLLGDALPIVQHARSSPPGDAHTTSRCRPHRSPHGVARCTAPNDLDHARKDIGETADTPKTGRGSSVACGRAEKERFSVPLDRNLQQVQNAGGARVSNTNTF